MSFAPNEEVCVFQKTGEDDPYVSVDELIKRLTEAKDKFQGNRAWSGPAFVIIDRNKLYVTRHNW